MVRARSVTLRERVAPGLAGGMSRRALTWIGLAWGWSVLWILTFHALVTRLRGPDVVRDHMATGGWEDYLLLLLVVPWLVGYHGIHRVFRAIHPDAPPAPSGLHFGPGLIVGWLLPVPFAWATVAVAGLLGQGRVDVHGGAIVARKGLTGPEAETLLQKLADAPLPYPLVTTVEALVVSVMLYALLRAGEEIGWRGILDRELAPLGPVLSAVVGAFAWAVAYLPLVAMGVYFPGTGVGGALALLGGLFPLGLALIVLRRRGGTVWASAAALGTLTGLSGAHELVLVGGDARWQSVFGPVGGGVVIATLLALVARHGVHGLFAFADPGAEGGAPPSATPSPLPATSGAP